MGESERCMSCGHPEDNHPYRHMFVGVAPKNRIDRMAEIIKENDGLRDQIRKNNEEHLELSHNLGVGEYKNPSPWLPATEKNLVVGDTRTGRDKGWFWLLQMGVVSRYREILRFHHIEGKVGYFTGVDSDLPYGKELDAIRIQPASAPPELEES